MSLENLDHDRGERENKEKRDKNKLPFPIRFGTNPNMMASWRKRMQEKGGEKNEGEQ